MFLRSFAVAIPFAFVASMTLAQAGATVEVAQSDDFGSHIVDGEGRPLYLFTTDKAEDGAVAITCTSADCLQAWPLFTTTGDPTAGAGATQDLIGTIDHEGETVVTYNGWPLYYYAPDAESDTPKGHDVESFGGEWYLVDPSGDKAGMEI